MLPIALEEKPTLPPTLKTSALTLETSAELLSCHVVIEKLGALESVSKLLSNARAALEGTLWKQVTGQHPFRWL